MKLWGGLGGFSQAGALPTALYPDILFFCRSMMEELKQYAVQGVYEPDNPFYKNQRSADALQEIAPRISIFQ